MEYSNARQGATISSPPDAASTVLAKNKPPLTPPQLSLVEPIEPDAVRGKAILTATLAQAGPRERFDDEFDWCEDESVVLKSQPATAIYFNPKGHIVIRQERSWAEESDPFVTISPENAVTFMEALAKRARE